MIKIKGKGAATLPNRAAVNGLTKGPNNITNYAKAVPNAVTDDRVALVTELFNRKKK